PDVVSESNLHRQPLYDMADLDRPKAVCAAHWVRDRAPDCRVEAHVLRLDPRNARGLLAGVDLVVDAADSYAVSYILSERCHPAGLALISASVLGLSGYVGGFCGGAPSYRAVFPDLPADGRSCATAGVLGPVVATLGALQAQMALAVLLRLSPAPLGRMVTVDLAHYRFGGFDFHSAPEPEGGFPFLAVGEVTPAACVIELRPEAEAPTPAVAQALPL
ncbi:HesA/MoeB/ThiF family protein, partial [Thioclava sp. BHET1]